jgi:ATP adenylyltransferase
MEYLQNPPEEEGCLFCRLLSQPDSPSNLIVYRSKYAFVVLNRYPYTNGHLMIVPLAHEPSLEGLDPPALQELILLTQRGLSILRSEYGAEAFNLGANIGEAAGAGIEGHVHLHLLPRWAGDTNFMATTAETRVLPETLDHTFERMARAWNTAMPDGAERRVRS